MFQPNNKWLSIFFIYLGSVCYTIASFYHLSFGKSWTFFRAYILALSLVAIEYVFNVIGNKGANKHISVFAIMLLIIAFDLINLFIINALLLKNKIDPLRNGISLVLIAVAVAISADMFSG